MRCERKRKAVMEQRRAVCLAAGEALLLSKAISASQASTTAFCTHQLVIEIILPRSDEALINHRVVVQVIGGGEADDTSAPDEVVRRLGHDQQGAGLGVLGLVNERGAVTGPVAWVRRCADADNGSVEHEESKYDGMGAETFYARATRTWSNAKCGTQAGSGISTPTRRRRHVYLPVGSVVVAWQRKGPGLP